MSGHTPGPWTVRYDRNGYAVAVTAPPDDRPGGIEVVVRQNGIGYPSSAAGKANARLIAAAPELLEALKMLVADEESGALFSQRIQQARAAIAKSEGRET